MAFRLAGGGNAPGCRWCVAIGGSLRYSSCAGTGRLYLAGIDPASGEVVEIADARRIAERHWGDPQRS